MTSFVDNGSFIVYNTVKGVDGELKIKLEHTYGNNKLSASRYNLVLGLILLWGFIVNYIICKNFQDFFLSMNLYVFLIGYFVSAIIGICMANFSSNAFISFIGYNLVVIPLGAILSIAVAGYSQTLVVNAVLATAIVCLIMTTLATIYPQFFEKLGRTLFIALLSAIIVEIILLLLGFDLTLMDWVVLIIFCGYIGYDWNKANSYGFTYDNAVDSALDLYLDIVNIFVRILSIMGRSNNRND